MAYLSDACDPAVHLLFSFGNKVKYAEGSLYHEEVLSMEVPLDSELPVQHFHLTLPQVNSANWLFGVLTLIVLQHIGISTHPTSA